ncbi:hypothetical protein ACFLTA_08630 [Bacteroidota bacterium]
MKKVLILFFGCLAIVNLHSQDLIVMKSGEEIQAIVLEVGIEVIKYKKVDNQQGPTYSIVKSDVFMIKYANGTKDVFSPENIQPKPIPEESPSELTIYQGFWGPKVMMDGKDLSNTQVLDLLMSNDEAHAAWSAGKTTQNAGLFIGSVGAALLGWEIGKVISDVPVNTPIFLFGAVGTLAGSLMLVSANKNLNSAVSLYNSSISFGKTPLEFNLKFGVTQNGLGLLLTLH